MKIRNGEIPTHHFGNSNYSSNIKNYSNEKIFLSARNINHFHFYLL